MSTNTNSDDDAQQHEIDGVTYIGQDGLRIPLELREFSRQIVFRVPSGTIQHFSSVGELDPCYGLIQEHHFGTVDEIKDPKNPELAPDLVSIKPEGEREYIYRVDLDADFSTDGGKVADSSEGYRAPCWDCGDDYFVSEMSKHRVHDHNTDSPGYEAYRAPLCPMCARKRQPRYPCPTCGREWPSLEDSSLCCPNRNLRRGDRDAQ